MFFVSSDIEDKICILYIIENQSKNYTEALKLKYTFILFRFSYSLKRSAKVQFNLLENKSLRSIKTL
ncbi:hypothetical protein GCM10022258_10110 [Aquimarina gracilis]